MQIKSTLDIINKEYIQNKERFIQLLSEHNKLANNLFHGAKTNAIEKHQARGKLLARQRIDLLVDENTPFLELSLFAAFGQYNNEFPYAGIVTGIGVINGIETVIVDWLFFPFIVFRSPTFFPFSSTISTFSICML